MTGEGARRAQSRQKKRFPLFTSSKNINGFVFLIPFINTVNPFRTAVPFWGQITYNLTGLSPKWDCGSRGVNSKIKEPAAIHHRSYIIALRDCF